MLFVYFYLRIKIWNCTFLCIFYVVFLHKHSPGSISTAFLQKKTPRSGDRDCKIMVKNTCSAKIAKQVFTVWIFIF